MKNKKYFLITILALMISAACFADSDPNPIPVDRLPQAARAFVKEKFPKATIVSAERELDAYECVLDNGIEIEFNLKGVWLKLLCVSLSSLRVVQANGLDNEESLDYGDDDNKEGNVWDGAW